MSPGLQVPILSGGGIFAEQSSTIKPDEMKEQFSMEDPLSKNETENL